MYISTTDWNNYIERLSKINKKAADSMIKFVQQNGFADTTALIDYAYLLATKYGEASAALSAEMYDAIAELSGRLYEPAVMAATADYGTVAKTINGVLKNSVNTDLIAGSVSRLVKQAGADTTLQNALRDGAEFAWVPSGDTCAFCITLASRGWQSAGKRAIKDGHAEHIHAHCDCTYAIRFSENDGVQGYDPKQYLDEYMNADTSSEGFGSVNNDRDVEKRDWQSVTTARINGMRRANYAKNKDMINAQKREAYALRKQAIEDGELKEE